LPNIPNRQTEREQQQQAEHGLDVNGDKKQRIDVESHSVLPRERPVQKMPVPVRPQVVRLGKK
jgi:hypothetical protein